MFQTIKLPYQTSNIGIEYIQKIQTQYSNMFRCSFNNCYKYETHIEKEQRDLVKKLNNMSEMDSWWLMCCVRGCNRIF